MILASRLHNLERCIGSLSAGGYDKTKSFFDGISCEALGVDVITGNMRTFNTSVGFDVHKTQVAYIEMSLSQVLEHISNVLFHQKLYIYLLYEHRTYDIYEIYFPLTCSASPACAKMMLFLKQAEFVISGNIKGRNFRKTRRQWSFSHFFECVKAMSQRRSKQSSF